MKAKRIAIVDEFETEALVGRLADTLAEVKAETLGFTLDHVDFVALKDTLAQTLAEVEVEKPGVTLGHVKALGNGRRAGLHASRK